MSPQFLGIVNVLNTVKLQLTRETVTHLAKCDETPTGSLITKWYNSPGTMGLVVGVSSKLIILIKNYSEPLLESHPSISHTKSIQVI